MPRTVCYQSDGEQSATWQRIHDPAYLTVQADGTLLLEPPQRSRATCNGIRVHGFQVLLPGDFVQVCGRSKTTSVAYRVGRVLGTVRVADGQETCHFTGCPIEGDVVECSCKVQYASSSARHLGRCLKCGASLNQDEPDELPPLELI